MNRTHLKAERSGDSLEHETKAGLKQKKLPMPGLLLLILAGGMGVLLLMLGGGGGRETSEEPVVTDAMQAENSAEALQAYTEAMESKIASLCECVEGVSNVRVAVTLLSGYEYVYAKNAEAAEGNGSTVGSYHYITVGSGSSESVVYVSEKLPKIGGIGIVCRGGGNATVRKELIELITAAFGVSSHQIYITEGA